MAGIQPLRITGSGMLFDERLSHVTAVLALASDPRPDNSVSVTISRRGISLRIAGKTVVRNAPLESFEARRKAAFAKLTKS